MEYNRPNELYTLLDNRTCFIKKPDIKLVKYIREFFNNKSLINKSWIDGLVKMLDKSYSTDVVSQKLEFPNDVYEVVSKDYIIRIFVYDTRFGNKLVMCGEQVVSINTSKTSLSIVTNSTFIDKEVLHSSIDEIEQRQLDFIRADMEGEIVYYDGDEFI